jgi:oligoendopeptidase F
MPDAAQSTAAGVRWDLTRLFAGAAAARAALEDGAARATALRARVDEIPGLDPAGLSRLLDETSELAGLRDLLNDEWGYGALRLLADADDDEARDLLAGSQVELLVVGDAVRAVAIAIGDADPPAAAAELAPYRHWIRHQAAIAGSRLGPDAEDAFAARTATAATAWGRLSQESLMAATVPFDAGAGETPHGVVELRLLAYHADRDVRLRAEEALAGIYEDSLPLLATCLDAIVSDRLAEDRLRRRADPMEATLVVDEVDRTTVERVLTAIEGSTGMLERWYERKRVALGLERIEACDRLGPVGPEPAIAWEETVALCIEAQGAVSPELAQQARDVFDGRRVDAERRPGKDGGIFCAAFAPGEAFLFLSYLDTAVGTLTVAHELGHATHYQRSAAMGTRWLAFEPESSAFCEVPSTLAELVVAERLREVLPVEEGKAALRLAVEGIFGLVHLAAVLTRFEQDACARRASGEALTPDRIREIWVARERAVFGELARPLGVLDWPHPFSDRFYNYQYAYSYLATLNLLASRRADPERFGAQYLAMLDATGTGSPAQLLALCGLDVEDAAVWERGLAELDRLCDLAW